MSELHYTYRVEWSPEDDEWVGLVAEFPSLSWLDPDALEALRGIRDLVKGVVQDMRESGEIPPTPLADRRYSGKVFVRTSPELHRRLTIEAAEQGVSVNQWAMQKLAERSGDVPQRQRADVLGAALDDHSRVQAEYSACKAAQRFWGACQQTGDPLYQQELLRPWSLLLYLSAAGRPNVVWAETICEVGLSIENAELEDEQPVASPASPWFGGGRDYALGK